MKKKKDKEIKIFIDNYRKLLEEKVNQQNKRIEDLIWSPYNPINKFNGLHSYITKEKP